jgi:hypothetical protein
MVEEVGLERCVEYRVLRILEYISRRKDMMRVEAAHLTIRR